MKQISEYLVNNHIRKQKEVKYEDIEYSIVDNLQDFKKDKYVGYNLGNGDCYGKLKEIRNSHSGYPVYYYLVVGDTVYMQSAGEPLNFLDYKTLKPKLFDEDHICVCVDIENYINEHNLLKKTQYIEGTQVEIGKVYINDMEATFVPNDKPKRVSDD